MCVDKILDKSELDQTKNKKEKQLTAISCFSSPYFKNPTTKYSN